MNRVLLLSILLAVYPPAFSQIVVNEVLADPVGTDGGAEKIEIVNLGLAPVDMTGYDAYLDLAGYFTFPAFTLNAGSIVVIHLRLSGTDTATDLYYPNPIPTTNMGNTSGSVALFSSTTHNSTTLVSFVQWGSGSQTWASTAVSAGKWSAANDFAPDVVEGHSLEYDGTGSAPSDWFDQSSPTIGVNNALPVQMVEFIAEGGMRGADLRWKTEIEVDNYGFEVERREISRMSTDIRGFESQNDGDSPGNNSQFTIRNSNWGKVGFVSGSGSSSSPHEYSFSDRDLPPGRYSYRIKQIDRSGTFAYTDALEVEIGLAPRFFALIQNYPNPFNPTTTIEFTLPHDGRVLMKVYNILGKEVATILNEERVAGRIQQVTFNAGGLSAGIYIVRLAFGGREISRRIALVK